MPIKDPIKRKAYFRANYAKNAERIKAAKRKRWQLYYGKVISQHRRGGPNSELNYKWRYNLTLKQLTSMKESVDYKCGICGLSETVLSKRLQVDHDPTCCPSGGKKTCGKCIRGLLCGSCNKMLGSAKDNIAILAAGIQYLQSRQIKVIPSIEVHPSVEQLQTIHGHGGVTQVVWD